MEKADSVPKLAPPPGLPYRAHTGQKSGVSAMTTPLPGLSQFSDLLSSQLHKDASSAFYFPPPGLTREIREVWSWNFEEESRAFLSIVTNLGANAVIALDTVVPGSICEDTFCVDEVTQYRMLC